MFYYSLDYAKNNGLWLVKSKSKNLNIIKERNLNHIIINNIFELYYKILTTKVSCIFTPTSHPLPFIKNQIIVCHDLYPFMANKVYGKFKSFLLKVSSITSNLTIGYINLSYRNSIIKTFGIGPKYLFMPNLFSLYDYEANIINSGVFTTIGLVGTSSPKKNHELVLSALSKSRIGLKVTIKIFGFENNYFHTLRLLFPKLKIELYPDSLGLHSFITSISCMISAAKSEGFARPVAAAALMNLPVILIDDEVYKEFYLGSSIFFNDEKDLLKILNNKSLLKNKQSNLHIKRRILIYNKAANRAISIIFGKLL